MIPAERFRTFLADRLELPTNVGKTSKYFRLLVAADFKKLSIEVLAAFARSVLKSGGIYVSAWGDGCERFHDCLDEVVLTEVEGNDVVPPLTTWHVSESLRETAQFFRDWAKPEERYESESHFWVCLAVGHAEWADIMQETVLER